MTQRLLSSTSKVSKTTVLLLPPKTRPLQMNPDVAVCQSQPPRFPVETWESIFCNLTSPGDLYNVSLLSRYIHHIVNPILYAQVFLDPNYYSIHTLSLLKRSPVLSHRIRELTLLSAIPRKPQARLRAESRKLFRTLDISNAPMEPCTHQFLHFFPSFTGLTALHIVNDSLPNDFLRWIFELPQLTTLEIRDTVIPADLQQAHPHAPLLLRTLTIIKCWTKSTGDNIPSNICQALLRDVPFLTTLTVDIFVEEAACRLLAELDHPPPIRSFSCHGLTYEDVDCSLICGALHNLPTITALNIIQSPRELGQVLRKDSLPLLQTLTGHLRALGYFFGTQRPLQYLTLTDPPTSSGTTPWETRLICSLESMRRRNADLKGLAFNLSAWSDEVFLCVCELWPGLKELRIQCTSGAGVDENLEVLHIYQKQLQHNLTECRTSKGVHVVTHNPLVLSPDEAEEVMEAPIHYRRWEKLCPSLREIAFDREVWWRRVFSEPGGWALMRDVIPALMEESNSM
ncbi:hypothetical protein JB92DRAFT_1637878 [Gautieria morchelliformis]|nr:hypothetical protein JB92DRAFT_1637878 [Gautieria morchelliformis]